MAKPANKSTAVWVVRRLREAGFEALFAGGCVRDMLLGIPCADYDVATSATPDQVKGLFGRVLLIGAKFGVAMVLHQGEKVEVTTFRTDLSYSDGRRPDSVVFATDKEDALRRDFTINGMFFDPIAERVIDYVGGQDDLRAGVVRTIGAAHERFAEDYLRMLRAVRFAVRFGFALDDPTADAIRRLAPKIAAVSGERIFDELSKMLSRPSAAEALQLLQEVGLAPQIMPELFEHPGQWELSVRRVTEIQRKSDVTLCFVAMLAGLEGKKIAAMIRRWGGANRLRDAAVWTSEHIDDWRHASQVSLAQFKRLMAHRGFSRLRRLWGLDERRQTGGVAMARGIARRVRTIDPNKVAPSPFVTGADLKTMGLTDGPDMGSILRDLYEAQLNERLRSRREALRSAREMAAKTQKKL